VPVLGTLIAIAVVGHAIRRKGFVNGVVDTSLDATPFVGTAKNVYELARGRDVIPDRPASAQRTARARA